MNEKRTGLAFDENMLAHQCLCANDKEHPENAERLVHVWRSLQQCGLVKQCHVIRSCQVTDLQLLDCHSRQHVRSFGHDTDLKRRRGAGSSLQTLIAPLACGGLGIDADTFWRPGYSSKAARLAAGLVLQLSEAVAVGSLRNGFALVRPPGHHALSDTAMGFCVFNSVAITAKHLLQQGLATRILIVDWDVHHGNGLQNIFYESNEVLYMSLHRHERGRFFPGTGTIEECGEGDGEGFTVNIPWQSAMMSDAEYLAAFRSVILPISKEFGPDFVLVSCGFDAALGDPLGGYKLSPDCFGWMTRQLSSLANGKLVLALEGGYNMESLSECVQSCVRTLLTDNVADELTVFSSGQLYRQPNKSAISTLMRVLNFQSKYWPCLDKNLPKISISHSAYMHGLTK